MVMPEVYFADGQEYIGATTFVDAITCLNGAPIVSSDAITMTGDLTINGTARIITDTNENLQILPTGTGFTQIGDAGSTSHTFNTNDDLFVSGRLEVDGSAYFDGGSGFTDMAIMYGGLRMPNDARITFGSGSNACLAYSTTQTEPAMVLGVNTNSRGFIICENLDWATDFGHGLEANPTVWIQSSSTVHPEYNVSIAHNQTDGVISTGAGLLQLMGNTGVQIGDAGASDKSLSANDDLFVSGKLEVDGDTYLDAALYVEAGNSYYNVWSGGSVYAGRSTRVGAGNLADQWWIRDLLGRNIIITDYSNRNQDHACANQTNPTFWIFSASDVTVDSSQWISFTHDQTDGVIDVGTGAVKFLDDIKLEANDIITDTTTGMKIGTATDQKLGFYNATPVTQRAKANYNNWASISDVTDALADMGLVDDGGGGGSGNGGLLIGIYEDVKSAGTDGGSATSGSWEKRTLNTASYQDGSLCSLNTSTSVITLTKGYIYEIRFYAPGYDVQRHQSKLRNTSDSSDDIIGGSATTGAFSNCTLSIGSGVIDLSSAGANKTFELQHRVSSSKVTSGHGLAANFGISEVYSRVEIYQIG